MKLHALSIELLLDDEFAPAHFLDRLFNSLGRTLAEHGRKCAEEVDSFLL